MSFTTPTTQSAGGTPTATTWNTDIVDNIIYLKTQTDTRTWPCKVFFPTQALTSGTAKYELIIPSVLNGSDLVGVRGHLWDADSSGTVTVQIVNKTNGTVDMLSTALTFSPTSRAGTAYTINTANDNVTTGDIIQIDVDDAGTDALGMQIDLDFYLT